jgi:hypothetical protein
MGDLSRPDAHASQYAPKAFDIVLHGIRVEDCDKEDTMRYLSCLTAVTLEGFGQSPQQKISPCY